MIWRLKQRAERHRAAKLARRRIEQGLCLECGAAIPEGLARFGALRCHECGTAIRSLTQADLTAAGLG